MNWFWFVLACQEDVAQVEVVCDERISYKSVGEPFLRNYCTGCHASKLEVGDRFGAPSTVNLDTYVDAKQWAIRSYVRAVHFQTMPPSGGISENERDRFKQWALCGAKGTETNTPTVESQERDTSRSIFATFVELDTNAFVLQRFIQDDDTILPENALMREEFYEVDGLDVSFTGFTDWDTEGDVLTSKRFEPGLPLGLDNWQDELDVRVTIWFDGEEWTETQPWIGIQGYQGLSDIDIHERESNPLVVQWWNEHGEEWGWRMSSDNVLSSTFGSTMQRTKWESQQFSGPENLASEMTFPIDEQYSWIELWIEWSEYEPS